jgi:hypothetical protein
MNRSISSLFTALLFSAAIMPNAMAQMQPRSPENLLNNSANSSEQSASDLTNPFSSATEALPEPAKSPAPVSTISAETAHGMSYRSMSHSHLTYCSIPPRAKPGDWDYREAMYNCLHGSD